MACTVITGAKPRRKGEKMAHSIHLLGYTILPIVAGILMLLAAYRAYGG